MASWNHSGGILIPASAGAAAAAAAAALRSRSAAGPGSALRLASGPPGLRGGGLGFRPPAAGALVLLGARPRGLPGGGHQIWPWMVLIVGEVQTLDGWLFVILQIVAVIMLAAPSAPLATALDGSLSAAAS